MLNAIGTKVVLKKKKVDTTTAGGIVLQTSTEYPRGEVITVGEKVENIVVGDIVIPNWQSAAAVESGGTEYHIIDAMYIFAKEV